CRTAIRRPRTPRRSGQPSSTSAWASGTWPRRPWPPSEPLLGLVRPDDDHDRGVAGNLLSARVDRLDVVDAELLCHETGVALVSRRVHRHRVRALALRL